MMLSQPADADQPGPGSNHPDYLATSSEVAGDGRLLLEWTPEGGQCLANNAKLARRLWAVSAQALVNRGLATLNEMIAFG